MNDLPMDEHRGSTWRKIFVTKPATLNVHIFPQPPCDLCDTMQFEDHEASDEDGRRQYHDVIKGRGEYCSSMVLDDHVTMGDIEEHIGGEIRSREPDWKNPGRYLVGIEVESSFYG